jgi:hypothetical protein
MREAEVDEVLDWVREIYGRAQDWPARLLRAEWYRTLRDVTLAEGMDTVRKMAKEHQKWPPTPMAVADALSAGGSDAGTGGGLKPCPDCYAIPGWREMAIRFVLPDGTEHVQERLAACECAAGRVRLESKLDTGARVVSWRDLWAEWQAARDRLVADGGHVVGVWRTHRDMLVIPVKARTIQAVESSGGAAYARAALRGVDERAGMRRRLVAQDALRDEGDGEVTW